MESVESLFRKHSSELYGYLCRMIGNRTEAEDILSDVFVKVMEQIKKTGLESFQWRPWLYRVSTNCAISHIRRQRIRSLFMLEKKNNPDETMQCLNPVEVNQEGGRVRGAVEQLNHTYKSALVMQIYQELSYQEIAEALKINIGTVKSRISEAKKKVKEILERQNG